MSSDAALLGLRGDLDEALTSDYLREQRWFGARTRDVSGVTVVDSVPIAVDLAVALVDVYFSGGGRALYQVLLGEDEAEVRDATRRPEISRRVLELVAAGGASEGRDGRITYKAIRSIEGVESVDVQLVGGDQSNTSTVVGNLMLKTYRRVVAGVNPELDMLLFFSEHGFAHVPNLVGWYSYAGSHIDATLGIVQCFVPDAVDGWKLGLDEVASAPAVFGARLRRLGEVVGEMHTVLASDAADPAFMPEEPTPESSGLVIAKIDEEIDSLFDEFSMRDELAPLAGRRDDARRDDRPARRRLHAWPHDARPRRLAPGSDAVGRARLARDRLRRRAGAPRERTPPEELPAARRGRHAPIDLLPRGHARTRRPPGSRGVGRRRAAQLLDGYRAGAPAAVLPQSVEAQDRQLGMFELEKAFYELRYELDNRPENVSIPVQSILAIIERQVQWNRAHGHVWVGARELRRSRPRRAGRPAARAHAPRSALVPRRALDRRRRGGAAFRPGGTPTLIVAGDGDGRRPARGRERRDRNARGRRPRALRGAVDRTAHADRLPVARRGLHRIGP